MAAAPPAQTAYKVTTALPGRRPHRQLALMALTSPVASKLSASLALRITHARPLLQTHVMVPLSTHLWVTVIATLVMRVTTVQATLLCPATQATTTQAVAIRAPFATLVTSALIPQRLQCLVVLVTTRTAKASSSASSARLAICAQVVPPLLSARVVNIRTQLARITVRPTLRAQRGMTQTTTLCHRIAQ